MKIAALFALPLAVSAQESVTGTFTSGGTLTNGGDIEIIGSLGGFGALAGGGDIGLRGGYPSQIYDPVRIAITPGEATLQENSAAEFAAEAVCDDDTILPVPGFAWAVDALDLSVTPDGIVTAGPLPQSFSATLTATAGDLTGSALLRMEDTEPDDYGAYAGDGLPDAWQTLQFGYENPDAAALADPDHDGQDNRTEYLAGTDPDNPSSWLRWSFAPAQDGSVHLVFSPWLPDRSFTAEWSDDLTGWTDLSGQPVSGPLPGEGLFIDPSAAGPRRCYRLRITMP